MKKTTAMPLVICSLFVALTAVCAQIAIPAGEISITLQLLPLVLSAALLPVKYATAIPVAYALMGMLGLPVFTGMSGGIARLFGVTGGYILGFIPCNAIISVLITKLGKSWWKQACAMVIGVLVCYAFGTAWFMVLTGRGLAASLSACVLPFLPFDALKIVVALILSDRLEKPFRRIWNH